MEKTLLNWIKRVLGIGPKLTRETYIPPNQNKPQPTDSTPMTEGDIRSGPAGCSPKTAYQESQYGSGFDDDAEWNEGDWR